MTLRHDLESLNLLCYFLCGNDPLKLFIRQIKKDESSFLIKLGFANEPFRYTMEQSQPSHANEKEKATICSISVTAYTVKLLSIIIKSPGWTFTYSPRTM